MPMRDIKKTNVDNILVNQASPEKCAAILLSTKPGEMRDVDKISEKLKMRAVEINGKWGERYIRFNLNRLSDLGLLEKTKENNKIHYALTSEGENAKDLLIYNEELFYDYMHYLHMKSAFEEEKDGYFLTYFLILRDIYEKGVVRTQKEIISDVFKEIKNILGENIAFKKSQNKTSVGKTKRWVKEPMTPPFLIDKEVNYRKDVDPFVILMSISSYYLKEGIPYNTPIILNDETKKEIAMMGLLDEKYFSSNIDKMSNMLRDVYIRDTVNGKTLTLEKKFDVEGIL